MKIHVRRVLSTFLVRPNTEFEILATNSGINHDRDDLEQENNYIAGYRYSDIQRDENDDIYVSNNVTTHILYQDPNTTRSENNTESIYEELSSQDEVDSNVISDEDNDNLSNSETSNDESEDVDNINTTNNLLNSIRPSFIRQLGI